MKLSEMGFAVPKTAIALVGQPEVTSFMDSDNKPYYRIGLVKPVMVHCSVDSLIDPIEADAVFMRERDLDQDFTLVTEGKPEEGYYIPNWVVDFSKGQELCLYQETTIRKWVRDNRGDRDDKKRTSINEKFRAMRNGGKKD